MDGTFSILLGSTKENKDLRDLLRRVLFSSGCSKRLCAPLCHSAASSPVTVCEDEPISDSGVCC